MARTNTLTNFLTDVASAIKQKTGDNTLIPASEFDTEILSIQTGGIYQTKSLTIAQNGNYIVNPDSGYDAIEELNLAVNVSGIDTSDATATTDDVINPKTFYAQGEKKTGGILAEYDYLDTSASVYVNQVSTSNNIAIATDYNILVEYNTTTRKFIWYKINANNTLTQLAEYSLYYVNFYTLSISQTLVDGNKLVIWAGGHRSTSGVYTYGRLDLFHFNINTNAVTYVSHLDMSSDIYPYHIVINPADPYIVAGMKGYKYTQSYLVYRYNGSSISGTGYYGYLGDYGYQDAEWSADGQYLLTYRSLKPSGTKTLYTCNVANRTVATSGVTMSYSPMCLYDGTYYITTSGIRRHGTNAVVKTATELSGATYFWTWRNVLYVIKNSNLYVYLINNDLSFTEVTTIQSVGSISTSNYVSILRPMSNMSGWFKINYLYCTDLIEGEYAITKAVIKNRDYVLLPAVLNNTTQADVLTSKAFINTNGVQYGTMPNRGAVIYTPRTYQQSISTGYHNGSVINAVTSSIDSDIQSKNIRQNVDILGVTGILANCLTFSTVAEMNAYTTAEEDTYAIVYGTTYVGTYRYDDGAWTQIGDSTEEQQIMDVLNNILPPVEQYEGVGGTDTQINAVLDSILGGNE